ncbi:MAG: hypothetical protein JOZ27_02600, partial [Caulobacteraceae bacterium]|nr:hypothetical protein [Caulobacteraceae bacterium]
VIIGVTEKPSRFGHPAFKYLAPAGALAAPAYVGDVSWFADAIYLPFRQMRLFAEKLSPALTGAPTRFDPARYLGQSIDTTGSIRLPDGRIKEGDRPASAAELMRGVRKLEGGMHPPILGPRFADIEFGDERTYVRRMAAAARARGVKVMFLFLPYYTGPDTLQEQAFYDRFGPTMDAGFLAPHAELYADYGHLTRAGAAMVTDWMAPAVAAELARPARRS